VLLLANPTAQSILGGLALALAGEALRIWASGHIQKAERLATGGPYAHTRNPLYLGSLLIGLGVALAGQSFLAAALVLLYFAFFYPTVMREEAVFLQGRFPQDYGEWARAVPVFLPRPLPAGPRATRFRWEHVRANREWRTLAALPAIALLLYARLLWLPQTPPG
jgi:hypothetical protein